jgi:hypothetical protein
MIALKGGEYLDQLLKSNALISKPISALDNIYALKPTPKLTRQDVPLGTSTQELLLTKEKLVEIGQHFKDNEIYVLGKRAITQITKQLDDKNVNHEAVLRQRREADATTGTRTPTTTGLKQQQKKKDRRNGRV